MVRSVWPPSRRWQAFLDSLPLDPDELTDPIEEPGPNDFIICGCPRTGTTLLSALLWQPPHCVVAMEPWDGMRLPPAPLFGSLRDEIVRTGRLTRQRMDIGALQEESVVRSQPEGVASPEIRVRDDFAMGVKWPVYWRFLERLERTRFLVCVRHPFEVVDSLERAGGGMADGFIYRTAFNRKMNTELQASTDDVRVRRVMLYDYVNSRILPHLGKPNVLVVRYEKWFADPEEQMAAISRFLGLDLVLPSSLIRPPRTTELSDALKRLVAENCRTAADLGYDLRSAS